MSLVISNTKDGFPGLFDNLFAPEFPTLRRSGLIPPKASLPKVNIKEDEEEFLLELAAPGLEKSDFKIELDHGLLTVSSDKREESLKEEKQYSKREFSFQAFRRVFTLPESVDPERISASYLNGVLLVHIPKKGEEKPQPPKSITIE